MMTSFLASRSGSFAVRGRGSLARQERKRKMWANIILFLLLNDVNTMLEQRSDLFRVNSQEKEFRRMIQKKFIDHTHKPTDCLASKFIQLEVYGHVLHPRNEVSIKGVVFFGKSLCCPI
jgi:hypothetical protein